MPSILAGVHLKDKTNDYIPIENLDFAQNVSYLREKIAEKLEYDANKIELIYNGAVLDDDLKLEGTIRPLGTVHCFQKRKEIEEYIPSPDITKPEAISRVLDLFNLISNIQINVNLRVNVLQKVVAEYPEFRRNLAAQAFIRDSVLFNTLHQPETIKNIAEHYPIICEAAPFIVDAIKKELTRNSSTVGQASEEPTTDSTNSSEEENSLGASSSGGDRRTSAAPGSQSENARIRMISRQQLQNALAQIAGSVNSLTNIAERNSDEATGEQALATSESGERISSQLFRNQLQRALNSFNTAGDTTRDMDMSEPQPSTSRSAQQISHTASSVEEDSGEIPSRYRTHQYAEQLRTMAQMGFLNHEENLTYLNITNGSIENAVNLLMAAMT